MNTINQLNNSKWVYFQVILLFFLINIVLGKSNLKLDLSLDQKNSVTESTVKVLGNIDSPVLVEAYVSGDLPGQLMAYIDPYVSTLKSIKSQGGDKIELVIINPELPEELQRAAQRGIQGISLTESKEIEVTSRKFFFGLYMQYGEESRVIQFIDPEGRIIPNLEYEFLKELRAMLRKDTDSGIAFIQARGALTFTQPNQREGYSKDSAWGFKTMLEQDLGKVELIGLDQTVARKFDTLILSGLPELSEMEIYNLDQFLMRGGNMVFLAKGYDFQIQQGQNNPYMRQFGRGQKSLGFGMIPEEQLASVNRWLGKYGLHINGEILIDASSGVIQINDPLRRTAFPQAYPAWAYYSREKGNISGQSNIIKYTNELIIPWPASLDIREAAQSSGSVKYKTLIQSNADAISTTSQPMDFNPLVELLKKGSPDRVGRPVPIAVQATGKFTSAFTKSTIPKDADAQQFKTGQLGDSRANLLVFASPYMVSDILLTGQLNFEIFNLNRAFFLNVLEALQGDDELLAARARIPAMAILEIKNPVFQFLFLLFHLFTIPVLLAIYGTFRLIRRNKKEGIESMEKSN